MRNFLTLIQFSIGAATLAAATVPSGFNDTVVTTGLSNPTAMAFAPDGRLFVCEQNGSLRVIKNGTLLGQPFLRVPVDNVGERGLLGLAFDPRFSGNGHIFVYYTLNASPRRNRISRFTAAGDVAVANSEQVILELDNLSAATNHNGGAMHFGIDGKLYVGVGENANPANARVLTNLLGKILRINADGTPPADNPFYSATSGKNRSIWAYGLRNPFTFAFKRGTSRMFINDVGQSAFEEINDGIAGSDYGWPATEGYTNNPAFQSPLHAYGRGNGPATGCAITGGTFYSPSQAQFPSQYSGLYFFADYCSGWIRTLDPATNATANFASGLALPVDLQISSDGILYYLSRGAGVGTVGKIEYPGNRTPVISSQPGSRTVTSGSPAVFNVSASGAGPLQYQWERNGVDISGATSSSYTFPGASTSDSGSRFRVVVSNNYGSVTSNIATLTVTSNRAPTGTISSPAAGVLYSAGQSFTYAGGGTDPEDGALPASAFTWRVDFHHDTHSHPFIPSRTGSKSGTFTIPTTGETAANVWYRIHLTVRDANSLIHNSFRDVFPRKVTIILRTSPPNLQMKLDGQPVVAPFSFQGVVGMVRRLEAVTPQNSGAGQMLFTSWTDGGAASHNISTPAADTTYLANFRGQGGSVTNLLSDSGFESNGLGWQKTTFSDRSVVTTQHRSGFKSQQMIADNQYTREVYQDVAVTAGQSYDVASWIRTDAIAAGAKFSLIWLNARGLPADLHPSSRVRVDVVRIVTGTTNWTLASGQFDAPPGAVAVRFDLGTSVESDGVGTAWFDDCRLTLAP